MIKTIFIAGTSTGFGKLMANILPNASRAVIAGLYASTDNRSNKTFFSLIESVDLLVFTTEKFPSVNIQQCD
jgi:hypothetical protein